jgi:hypothetical protein
MAAKDFEELALDGHNYPTWAMDVKISLSSRGIAGALIPPENPPQEGDAQVTEQQKYTALALIRQHIHPDLKSEYLMEESPSNMWQSLKTIWGPLVTELVTCVHLSHSTCKTDKPVTQLVFSVHGWS